MQEPEATHLARRSRTEGHRNAPSPSKERARDEREIPPELVPVVDAWADLPEHVRQAILTLAEAARGERK